MFLVFATGVPSRKLQKGTPAAKTIAFGNLPFGDGLHDADRRGMSNVIDRISYGKNRR
jgi:hypothetical protein